MESSSNVDFWKNIETLRCNLLAQERSKELRDYYQFASHECRNLSQSRMVNRHDVVTKIEELIVRLLDTMSKDEAPSISYSSRSTWKNVKFKEGIGLYMVADTAKTSVRFDHMKSVNKFALTMKVLSMIYQLIQSNSFATKRDMYYKDPKLFGSQSQVDDIVDNLSCMLAVPRWHLHVMATSKGCIAGNIQYVDSQGNHVDCSQTNSGILISNQHEAITSMTSNARFVLVVEKDATFQSLLDGGILNRLSPCILITGKGFPDVNTRLMLRLIWDRLHLPILALVDADPHGIEIMAVYKYGSKSLAFDGANLAVPVVWWLGVLPSDTQRLQIPASSLLPMTSTDHDKARDLLQRPYMSTETAWKAEIELMLSHGTKAEIQCLASLSPTFLTDVYLPNKIRYGGWI